MAIAAAQLAYMMEDKLKVVAEEADKERALKEPKEEIDVGSWFEHQRVHESLAPTIPSDPTPPVSEVCRYGVRKGLVRMKALQIKCVAKEASTKRLRTCLANEEAKMDQVKANVIAKFQTSQPYFDKLGVHKDVLDEEDTDIGETGATTPVVGGTDGKREGEADKQPS
nr:hypothetical protein CFP56_65999 [Quercus suber]